VGSLPVRLGVAGAARAACIFMLLSQLAVIALLLAWSQPLHAVAVGVLLLVQARMMLRFLAAPRARALWLSAFGVPLFVAGMMVTAFAIRGLGL
jgi:chlorophyll synthase